MSSPSNPRTEPRDSEAEIAALIAGIIRLSRNSFKLGHRLSGLPEPDPPDVREQALALLYKGFELSGPEDPRIDQEARDLFERIVAGVLAHRPLAGSSGPPPRP